MSNPNMQFSGQVALVTGAANGIGRATAQAFGAAGLKVVVSDIDASAGEQTVALIREAGGEAIFIPCNVAVEAEVKALVDRTVAHYGRLDYACNNAGTERENPRLTDGTEAEFDRLMGVNVKGVWLGMKYQMKAMLARGGDGAIVNIASYAGLRAAPGLSVYSATKHAVVGLTRSAGRAYAKQNIRVNAVCPGVIDTAMFRHAIQDKPELAEALTAMHPVKRLGRPEEIAHAVLYLCSDGAAFTTGQALSVDGGMTA